jgi:hypothetical protein
MTSYNNDDDNWLMRAENAAATIQDCPDLDNISFGDDEEDCIEGYTPPQEDATADNTTVLDEVVDDGEQDGVGSAVENRGLMSNCL